jgi:hypothetical protein
MTLTCSTAPPESSPDSTGSTGQCSTTSHSAPDLLDCAARVLAGQHRVDQPVLDYFAQLLTQHFTTDKTTGPRRLLGMTLAQMRVLHQLRRDAEPATTKPLLRVLAQYAEFTGWLHQDLGHTTAADRWSGHASRWAHAAGDHTMAAYLMIRKSHIALQEHDTTTAIQLAAAARNMPGATSPRLHALAAQQEARGRAAHGDVTRFPRALEHADSLLRKTPPNTAPTHRTTCGTTASMCWRSNPPPATGHAGKPLPPPASSKPRSQSSALTCVAIKDICWPNSPTRCGQPKNLNQNERSPSASIHRRISRDLRFLEFGAGS